MIRPVFAAGWDQFNRPDRIVTLGLYYPQAEVIAARGALEGAVREEPAGYDAGAARRMREGVQWTRWINALGKGRRWAERRLFERLDTMLEPDIAVAVVPGHTPYQPKPAIHLLAQRLAAHGRVDATTCLVRHTPIRRILFGGPSTRRLHRGTISVADTHLVQDRPVLLLDDIARSGESLIACRLLLLEAGAGLVQAMALGRTVVSREDAL